MVATVNQAVDEMGPNKSCSSSYQGSHGRSTAGVRIRGWVLRCVPLLQVIDKR